MLRLACVRKMEKIKETKAPQTRERSNCHLCASVISGGEGDRERDAKDESEVTECMSMCRWRGDEQCGGCIEQQMRSLCSLSSPFQGTFGLCAASQGSAYSGVICMHVETSFVAQLMPYDASASLTEAEGEGEEEEESSSPITLTCFHGSRQ